jgi:hypothetical protein
MLPIASIQSKTRIHRLDQLRFLATQTDDPLAERLVRDLIVELEDRLTPDLSPVKYSPD